MTSSISHKLEKAQPSSCLAQATVQSLKKKLRMRDRWLHAQVFREERKIVENSVGKVDEKTSGEIIEI